MGKNESPRHESAIAGCQGSHDGSPVGIGRGVTGLLLGREDWLSGKDSNLDKGLQRALCYHYTTGQTGAKLMRPAGAAKVIPPSRPAARTARRQ